MGEGAGDGARGDPRGGGPGALSRLLDELARAPRADPEAAWGKGLRPGDVLDRFEIIRELGRGGFGAVYEAVDRELGRKVALKTLRPGRSRDEWVDAQLRAEAQAAARLSHPGIVTLHEACTCDRGPYLVMELLHGETLEARLSRGPLPPGEAVEVGLQISRALAHVHSHGLVHRDMKPGNVFLGEDGRVKLLDLGLAHLLGRKSSTGGTPAYVAPEQWRGEAVDGRADVFALGAVLFEMASGRRAFEVKEERSSALDPGPAPALEGRAPRGLVRLVARCLAKDPGARPTAAQAAEDLLAIQRGLARPRAVRRLALLVSIGVLAGIAIATLALRGALWPVGGVSPEGRIAVAVADVVNETGEKELDVLSGLLVTSLEQSRRLSVMTQARLLDLAARAGRKDAVRVDETLGREVGKVQGVRALLLPAIRRLGTTYSLEMRAIDPGRDEHLFTLSDRATSKEGLLDLLDRLSERTRTELGERGGEVAKASVHLSGSVTRSLEAYQHYIRGIDAWYRDRHGAAGLRELLDAVRLDSRFAAAHAELASLYEAHGRPDLAAPHWRAAGEHRAHMPEKERLLLDLSRASSLHAPENRSPTEVRRIAAALEARFADDKFVLWAVGDAYLDADVRERAKAEHSWRRALELDPGDCRAAGSLEWVLGDRPADLIASARLAVATRRSACNLTVLARAERAAGSLERAAKIAREALQLDGVSNSLIVRAACEVLDGVAARPACSSEWKRLLEAGANELERDFARFQLAASLAIAGRRREALRLLGPMPGEWRGDPLELARLLAIGIPMPDAAESRAVAQRIPNQLLRRYVLTIYGGADEADALSAALPASERFEFAERLYEPLRLARQGRYAEAAESQRRARDQALVDEGEGSAYWMACFLAELLLAAGRLEEAASVQVRHSQSGNLYLLGHASHGLRLALARARALEQLGRRADALREVDGVVAFWKEADDDLPLLVEAKAMRKRLAAASAAAGTPAAAKARANPSIAVLPFADMSPAKDQEYFADGVAEEILNALSSVQGLRVPGRSSSFYFKGRNVEPAQIARKLGVEHLLDGSVRRSGNRLRVTAEVVKASGGDRLWSQTFERELTDVFAVQDEIARAVVEVLKGGLLAGTSYSGLHPSATTSPEAYSHYLLGQRLYRLFSPDSLRQAVSAFEKAVALDPRYAPAWAAMSIPTYYVGVYATSQEEALAWAERALAAAEKALVLSPDLCDGLSTRGYLRGAVRWDWTGGIADLAKSVRLCPGNPDGWRRYSVMLATFGRLGEAVPPAERAVQLDPLGYSNVNLSHILRETGNAERCLAAAERALDAMPDSNVACGVVADALLALGRPADSLEGFRRCPGAWAYTRHGIVRALWSLGRAEEARSLLRKEEEQPSPKWVHIGVAHAWMGDRDKAFESLNRAVDAHDLLLGDGFLARRELRPLQADPRWKALLRRMNLPAR